MDNKNIDGDLAIACVHQPQCDNRYKASIRSFSSHPKWTYIGVRREGRQIFEKRGAARKQSPLAE
jgi:hypothetical protein